MLAMVLSLLRVVHFNVTEHPDALYRPADHPSPPRGHSTQVHHPRSRRHLRRLLLPPGRGHGRRAGAHRTAESLAEPACRRPCGLGTSRIPRPRHRPRRAPSRQDSQVLYRLLPQVLNASVAREGCTRATGGAPTRHGRHRGAARARRVAPSLRASSCLTIVSPPRRRRTMGRICPVH
jgi:hypothetical protein